MKIIVCVKVVIDPEAPVSLFKIDAESKKIIPPQGTPPVLNPFDENALEAGLRLKDSIGASITVMSLGKNIPKPVIKKSLAVGADGLILLEDAVFDNMDSYSTAKVLADAIEKTGNYDLILCGREAADTDAGQVGLGIAEILGIPSVSLATGLMLENNGLKVERMSADGYETISACLPALVTVSSEAGNLRTATLPGIREAQKKPVTVWNSHEPGIGQPQANRINLHKIYQPVRESECEFIASDAPEEAAVELAQKLRDINII